MNNEKIKNSDISISNNLIIIAEEIEILDKKFIRFIFSDLNNSIPNTFSNFELLLELLLDDLLEKFNYDPQFFKYVNAQKEIKDKYNKYIILAEFKSNGILI